MTGLPPQFQGWWPITETAADPAAVVVHEMPPCLGEVVGWLASAEPLALMLHDMFAIAFDDIAATPPAAHEYFDAGTG